MIKTILYELVMVIYVCILHLKVHEFVKLDEVYYAGSHGMDIKGPPQQVKTYDGKNQIKALDKKVS